MASLKSTTSRVAPFFDAGVLVVVLLGVILSPILSQGGSADAVFHTDAELHHFAATMPLVGAPSSSAASGTFFGTGVPVYPSSTTGGSDVFNVSWSLLNGSTHLVMEYTFAATGVPGDVHPEGHQSAAHIRAQPYYAAVGFCPTLADGPIVACAPTGSSSPHDLVACLHLFGKDFDVLFLPNDELVVLRSAQVDMLGGRYLSVRWIAPAAYLGLEHLVRGGSSASPITSEEPVRTVFCRARWDAVRSLPLPHTSKSQYAIHHMKLEGGSTSSPLLLSPITNNRENAHHALVVSIIVGLVVMVVGVSFRHSLLLAHPMTRNMFAATVGAIFAALLTYYVICNYKDYRQSGVSVPVGRCFGDAAVFVMALMMYPLTRHVGIGPMLNIPTEKLSKYHQMMGLLLFLLTFFHVVLMSVVFARSSASRYFLLHDTQMLGGILAVVTMTVLTIPALFLRRRLWAVFRYTHMLYPMILAFTVIHHPSFFRLLAPALFFYLCDISLRRLRMTLSKPFVLAAQYHSAARLTELDIVVDRGTGGYVMDHPSPGQYGFLGVTQLGILLHPFTICAVRPYGEKSQARSVLTLLVKDMGNGRWTERLGSLVRELQDPESEDEAQGTVTEKENTRVEMERLGGSLDTKNAAPTTNKYARKMTIQWLGPYGRLTVPLKACHTVLMIAGGIGVTPLLHFLDMLGQEDAPVNFPRTHRVELIWSVRDSALLQLLEPRIAQALNAIRLRGVECSAVFHHTSHGLSAADDTTTTAAESQLSELIHIEYTRPDLQRTLTALSAEARTISMSDDHTTRGNVAFHLRKARAAVREHARGLRNALADGGGGGDRAERRPLWDQDKDEGLHAAALADLSSSEDLLQQPICGVYCCGPAGMKNDVTLTVERLGNLYLHTDTFEL